MPDGGKMKQEKNKIQIEIEEYESTVKEIVVKQEEIETLKKKLSKLEIERTQLDIKLKKEAMEIEAEVYNSYTEKDLLRLVDCANKLAKKEVAADFKQLVDKFKSYELGVNDISQLQTYIELYGKYVRENNTLLKQVFKIFGGELDE